MIGYSVEVAHAIFGIKKFDGLVKGNKELLDNLSIGARTVFSENSTLRIKTKENPSGGVSGKGGRKQSLRQWALQFIDADFFRSSINDSGNSYTFSIGKVRKYGGLPPDPRDDDRGILSNFLGTQLSMEDAIKSQNVFRMREFGTSVRGILYRRSFINQVRLFYTAVSSGGKRGGTFFYKIRTILDAMESYGYGGQPRASYSPQDTDDDYSDIFGKISGGEDIDFEQKGSRTDIITQILAQIDEGHIENFLAGNWRSVETKSGKPLLITNLGVAPYDWFRVTVGLDKFPYREDIDGISAKFGQLIGAEINKLNCFGNKNA